MMKKTVLGMLCLSAFALMASGKYENPALNKVSFEKAAVHADIELVRDGILNFAIVCDFDLEKKAKTIESGNPIGNHREALHLSAGALQKAFLRCTGCKPVVISPNSPELSKYKYKILLGKSIHTEKLGIKIEEMPVEGFKIMSYPEGIAIAGCDGSMIPGSYHDFEIGGYAINGTLNGVYDFAERFLGMRFYFPGLGVHVPPVKNLVVSPVAYTDHPQYLTRNFGQITSGFKEKGTQGRVSSHAQSSVWPWDDVANDQRDFHAAYRQARSSRFMCSEGPHPFRLGETFPDKLDTIFYREKNGKLHYSPTVYTDNYFDVSNPEFAGLLADSFKKFYDTNGKWMPLWQKSFPPTPEYVWFGPVDTKCFIDNKRAAKFRKKNPQPYNEQSELNGNFNLMLANLLEKRLPGKKLAIFAYSNYLEAPETVKRYPDNVRVLACVGTPAYIMHPGYAQFFTDIYTGWNKKTAGKSVAYPYDPSYHPQGGFSHAVRGMFEGEFLKKMRPYISEKDAFICCYFKWEFYYSTYLMARAYWNPDFDADAALDEHWPLLYGDAAPYLREFHKLIVERWTKNYVPKLAVQKRSIPGIDYDILYKEGYPREIGLKLQEFLEKAKKAVKPGSDEERRLIFFSMPWEKLLGELFAYQKIVVPQYKITFAGDEKIEIDGKAEESVWKKAVPLPFKAAFCGEAKKLAFPDAKMLWNKSGIYISFKSQAPYQKTGNLFGEDNMEFFLSPGIKKNAVFQFVLSSSGKYEDYYQSFDPPRPFDINWFCKGIKKAAVTTDNEWSCEMFIPFSALDGEIVPIPGDYWYGNMVSNRTDSEAASFSPTLGNNRNINTYAKLYFAGNCE